MIATTLGGSRLISKAVDATTSVAKSAGGLLSDAAAFGLGAGFGNRDSDGDGTKGINDDEPKEEENRDGGRKGGINEDDPRDAENDKDGQLEPEDEGTSSPEEGNDEPNPNDTDSEQDPNNGLDGPGPINKQEDEDHEDPSNSSLDDLEPPSEGNDEDNHTPPFNIEEDSGETPRGRGINHENPINNYPNDDHESDWLPDSEEPTGINEELPETDETEPPLPPKPGVGPTKVDHELSQLKQSNPLKKEVKQKVFGYDINDPRRYGKQTMVEKKKSSFEAGNEYQKYRQRKKELKMQKKKGD